MKVIISRKGFDSKYGGIPSPIMPDGTLLSLPIPYETGRTYSALSYDGETYEDIVKQLKPKFNYDICHVDPDIRQGVFDAPVGWMPVFGQDAAALSHLQKQGVSVGDLFLFFGWFRQAERVGDKLRYVPKAPDLHIIYGYLQVGAVITGKAEIQKYNWHPHAQIENHLNSLFVARDTCSWNDSLQGSGVFTYDKRLVLTKDGMSRRYWDLPAFFKELTISRHSDKSWHTDSNGASYFQSVDIGQEFVIEENLAVEKWAQGLVELNDLVLVAQ